MTSVRTNIYEDVLCIIGIGGGIFTLLLPHLVPYMGDVVWVCTLTVLSLWASKKILPRFPPLRETMEMLTQPPHLQWWMLTSANQSFVLVVAAEMLQYLNILPGVFDRYDFVAFGAGYGLTLILLIGAYITVVRQDVRSSLW